MSQTMTPPPAMGTPPTDPNAAPTDPTAPTGPTVACTVMDNGDGTYTVYAGDEPEEAEGGDMSGDDADAMSGGDQPAGQQASSVGEAVKDVAMILQGGSSSGGQGATDQAFASGFGGGAGATPPPAPIRTRNIL